MVVGAGCSTLITELVADGYRSITAVDISAAALDQLEHALGENADAAEYVVSDVCAFTTPDPFDVWHDRATFHFLAAGQQQSAYVERVAAGLKQGGHLVLAGFAPDGPEQCSGLDVARHSVADLVTLFGDEFELIDSETIDHVTPWESAQRFVHTLFRRR